MNSKIFQGLQPLIAKLNQSSAELGPAKLQHAFIIQEENLIKMQKH